jgi:hypothetical protein
MDWLGIRINLWGNIFSALVLTTLFVIGKEMFAFEFEFGLLIKCDSMGDP